MFTIVIISNLGYTYDAEKCFHVSFSVFSCFFNFSDVDYWPKGHYCYDWHWLQQVLRASQPHTKACPSELPIRRLAQPPIAEIHTSLLRALSGTKVRTQQSSSTQSQCHLGQPQNNAHSDLWYKVQSSHPPQVGWLWSLLSLLPKVPGGIKFQVPTEATGWITDHSCGCPLFLASLPHPP